MAKTADEYRREIEDLRARLQEAEDTLDAIRGGEVDAIVVSQGQQEQIFTLQGAESGYRIMLDNMSEGAATLTAEGTIVYCNARFAEMLGGTLEDVLGSQIESHIVADSWPKPGEPLEQAGRAGYRGEARSRRRDLTEVPVFVSLNALPGGQAGTVSLVATDLTEQKRHEEVRAAEELARSILEQAAEPIVVCNPDGIIMRASQAAHELCGEPAIWQPFQKVFPLRPAPKRFIAEEDRPPLDAEGLFSVEQITSGRICRRAEMTFLRADGRQYDLLVSGVPLVKRQDEKVGCMIGLVDVTERKRVAEQLREQAELLNLVYDAVLVRDMEGRIRYWNRGAEDLYGWGKEEAIGRISHELLRTQYPQPLETIAAAVKERGRWQGELLQARRDGRVAVVDSRWALQRNENGEATGILEINRDISEYKASEDHLKALNDTLEQRVARRTAEVHERMKQLQRLTSQLTQTEQRERRHLAELLHDHLQQLLVGAKFGVGSVRGQVHDDHLLQSLRQVDELLDQSIQASRSLTLELSPPVLYSGGLSQALQWLGSWMREKHGLVVEMQTDGQANPGDEDVRVLLFQSVRELLFNVVKHAGVKKARVVMSLLDPDRLQIVVSDPGKGFDPGKQGRRTNQAADLAFSVFANGSIWLTGRWRSIALRAVGQR